MGMHVRQKCEQNQRYDVVGSQSTFFPWISGALLPPKAASHPFWILTEVSTDELLLLVKGTSLACDVVLGFIVKALIQYIVLAFRAMRSKTRHFGADVVHALCYVTILHRSVLIF
jgi:hypothetical protein